MCVVVEYKKAPIKRNSYEKAERLLRDLPKEFIPLVEGFIQGIIDSVDRDEDGE